MSDPRVVLHIGMPKAASKTLQWTFFPEHPQVWYLGILKSRRDEKLPRPFPGLRMRDQATAELFDELLLKGRDRPDLVRARDLWEECAVQGLEEGLVPVFSWESLMENTQEVQRVRAENLKAVLGPCKIVVVLRHPLELMESLYLQLLERDTVGLRANVRDLPYEPVAEWLEGNWDEPGQPPRAHLEHAEAIEVFADVFGSDSVGIFLLEQLREDPTRFTHELGVFMGIDPEVGPTLAGQRWRNTRWTQDQLDAYLRIHRSRWRSALFRLCSRKLRRRILGIVPGKVQGRSPAKVEIPEPLRTRILHKTKEGYERLGETWDVPFHRYGYFGEPRRPRAAAMRPRSSRTRGETPAGCVHIGLPKTASSTLQRHLFAGHSEIHFLGQAGGGHFSSELGRALAMELNKEVPEDRLDGYRRQLDVERAKALEAGQTMLLSREGLSRGGGTRQKVLAANLSRVFGSVRIVLVVRHPLTLMESLYLQRLRGNNVRWELGPGSRPKGYFTIEEWLECQWRMNDEAHFGYLQVHDVARNHASLFGRENVGVFVYEQLREDSEAFLRGLCRFIGVDPEEGVRLTRHKHANPRMTVDQLERLKAVQRFPWRRIRFRLGSPADRLRMLTAEAGNPSWDSPKAEARIPEIWRRRILDIAQDQLHRLKEEWDLPLEDYGYPL